MNRIRSLCLCIGIVIGTGQLVAAQKSAVSALDKNFLMAVAQGNLAEIQSGELAFTKSADNRLQSVAQRIINDHTRAQEETRALGKSLNVPLPNAPNAQQKAAYETLKKLSGERFDRTYLQDQVKAHSQTIALFQKEQKTTANPQLRAFAAKTLPVLRHHAESLRKLQTGI